MVIEETFEDRIGLICHKQSRAATGRRWPLRLLPIKYHAAVVQGVVVDELTVRRKACVVAVVDVIADHDVASLIGALARSPCLVVTAPSVGVLGGCGRRR